MSNIQSVMCPSVLWMSKPGNSVTALLQISLYFQTLFIWLYKAAERRKRRRKRTEGMGARDDEHYVGSVCACFQLTVHLIKTWNVLVVYSCCPSATVAKSSNMYLIFLCAMFFLFFLFFFFFWMLFIFTQHLKMVGDRLWLLWLERHLHTKLWIVILCQLCWSCHRHNTR